MNLHLVDAQQARRVLDRLVGYKISPLLWDKVRRGLSAGRVQTVALRLIVEREREIRAFLKREYWTIDVAERQEAAGSDGASHQEGRRNARDRRRSRGEEYCRRLDGATYLVKSVATREKKRNPVPPFITSTLAAGIVAQAALQREAHHDAGAAAV